MLVLISQGGRNSEDSGGAVIEEVRRERGRDQRDPPSNPMLHYFQKERGGQTRVTMEGHQGW